VGADPVRTGAVTAIVGLFLAAVLAATRERLWGTIASPGEAEAVSGMAVLGEVPKLKGDGLLTTTDLGGAEHQLVKGVVDWVSALHQAGDPATGVMRRLAVVGIGPRGVAAPLAHNIAVCLAQRGPVTLVANAEAESSGLSGPTWLELTDDASNSMAAARTQGVDVAAVSLGDWEDLQVIAGGWNDPFIEQPHDPGGTDSLLNALGGPSSQLVLEVDNLRASPAAALAACTADAVLVVVTLDRSRPDELRATIDLLQSYGAPVAGLVVQHRSRYQPVPWSALVRYPTLMVPEPDTEPLAAAAAPIA
jgi:hypothetical protein